MLRVLLSKRILTSQRLLQRRLLEKSNFLKFLKFESNKAPVLFRASKPTLSLTNQYKITVQILNIVIVVKKIF